MRKKEIRYTRSLKPEALIYALRKSGVIHNEAIHLDNVIMHDDEVQVTYSLLP